MQDHLRVRINKLWTTELSEPDLSQPERQRK